MNAQRESKMDSLQRAILDVMESETRRIVDEEAKSAAERVEQRVRAMAGQIATRVASYVTFDAFQQELRITVQIPERGKV